MPIQPEELYRRRFADVSQPRRVAMWEVLCRVVLQRYVRPTDTVVDLGAGFCEFITAIRCRRKIAVDTNRHLDRYAGDVVETVAGEIPAVLEQLADDSAHVVFSSNFLEHLPDKDAVLEVLRQVHRILAAGGRVVVLQP